MIYEVDEGSLLQSEAEALVNPVNCEGVMGAGLALAFRDTYPKMFLEYEGVCRRRMLRPGQLHFWLTGASAPKFVVNFPTKDRWRNPSRLEWVIDGLAELRRQLELRQIMSVAMPALGCGLGGLSWVAVRRETYRALWASPTEVFLYPPR